MSLHVVDIARRNWRPCDTSSTAPCLKQGRESSYSTVPTTLRPAPTSTGTTTSPWRSESGTSSSTESTSTGLPGWVKDVIIRPERHFIVISSLQWLAASYRCRGKVLDTFFLYRKKVSEKISKYRYRIGKKIKNFNPVPILFDQFMSVTLRSNNSARLDTW